MLKINPSEVSITFNQNKIQRQENNIANENVAYSCPQDSFVKRNKKKIGLSVGAFGLLLSAIFYFRYKRNKKLDLQIQKDLDVQRKKAEKEIEELRKKLNLETQQFRQNLIDDFAKSVGIDDACTSWEELDKKYAEKRLKDKQKFQENLDKQKKEFDSIFNRFKQQSRESQNSKDEFTRWWNEYKANWQKAQEEQQKKWKETWSNWQKSQNEFKNRNKAYEESFRANNKQNESKSQYNNTSQKNNKNYTNHKNSYDKEDYSGFNDSEIIYIKSTFSSETNLRSHIFNKKDILAKYIESTEDDIVKLFNKDKNTYRKLSLKWHPDKIHLETKEGRFKLINYIYNY